MAFHLPQSRDIGLLTMIHWSHHPPVTQPITLPTWVMVEEGPESWSDSEMGEIDPQVIIGLGGPTIWPHQCWNPIRPFGPSALTLPLCFFWSHFESFHVIIIIPNPAWLMMGFTIIIVKCIEPLHVSLGFIIYFRVLILRTARVKSTPTTPPFLVSSASYQRWDGLLEFCFILVYNCK